MKFHEKNVSFDCETNEFFVVSLTARRKLMGLGLGRKWFIQSPQGNKRMRNRIIRSCSVGENDVTKISAYLSESYNNYYQRIYWISTDLLLIALQNVPFKESSEK